MAGLLRLTCRRCDTSYVSAFQGLAWPTSVGCDRTETCPHCGATGRYSPDHYYSLSRPDEVAAPRPMEPVGSD